MLPDVFEQFQTSCLNTYYLNPTHYYTLPSYTWDCMLEFTQVDIKQLADIDMIMFIERDIRGGLSRYSKRYANYNKFTPSYNPLELSKFLIYDEITNQYR